MMLLLFMELKNASFPQIMIIIVQEEQLNAVRVNLLLTLAVVKFVLLVITVKPEQLTNDAKKIKLPLPVQHLAPPALEKFQMGINHFA